MITPCFTLSLHPHTHTQCRKATALCNSAGWTTHTHIHTCADSHQHHSSALLHCFHTVLLPGWAASTQPPLRSTSVPARHGPGTICSDSYCDENRTSRFTSSLISFSPSEHGQAHSLAFLLPEGSTSWRG